MYVTILAKQEIRDMAAGHKEALLEGAMKCIVERGYARTKARDVVEASGTNLASIGYHFGSLENLLGAALVELQSRWGDRLEVSLEAIPDSAERFRVGWAEIIRQIREDRNISVASVEVLTQSLRSETLRKMIVEAYREGAPLLLAAFAGDVSEISEDEQRLAGDLVLALISGIMVRHLVDPDGAPDADDLIKALRVISRVLGAPAKG